MKEESFLDDHLYSHIDDQIWTSCWDAVIGGILNKCDVLHNTINSIKMCYI